MNSVRRAALIWMTLLLTLVGLVGAGGAYTLDLSEANVLLDGQLRQIAVNAAPILNGPTPVSPGAPAAARSNAEDGVLVQIWDRGNALIYASDSAISIPRLGRAGFETLTVNGKRWRTYMTTDAERTVQASQRVSVRTQLAQTAALEAAIPILVTIPLGWLVIGWGLQRVLGSLTGVAAEIAVRGAETKTPIPVTDIPIEVLPLVEAMNLLIGRLQTSLDQQKRFLSDAAHELRTPLAALRLQIDNLMPGVDPATLDGALPELGRGADRAAILVDQLLRLARYDAVVDKTEPQPIDLVPLVLSCVADHVQIAERKQVDLGVISTDQTTMHGTEKDLKILFDNLIQNAVRYTPPGGVVDVAVRLRGGVASVEVSDTGCGIREEHMPRVFDRFFRAAPPEIEGTGLGLSICQAIATRYGLSIRLQNRTDGQGLVASVTEAEARGLSSHG